MGRFVFNPGFERGLQREVEHRHALAEAAKPAAAAANRMVKRIMPSRKGPAVVVEQDIDGVRVVNTDHGGHLDEWGSINNSPNASVRRGAREAGLDLRE